MKKCNFLFDEILTSERDQKRKIQMSPYDNDSENNLDGCLVPVVAS